MWNKYAGNGLLLTVAIAGICFQVFAENPSPEEATTTRSMIEGSELWAQVPLDAKPYAQSLR